MNNRKKEGYGILKKRDQDIYMGNNQSINEDFGIMTNSMDLANYVISIVPIGNHNF